MATSNTINPTTGGISSVETQKRVPKQELGKNEFLEILSVQMANQDPLEPMQDTDFIAQMAQFTSLEQMQSLNSSFTTSQAYSLIGKNVVAAVNGEQVLGMVTGVLRQNNQDLLQVGSYTVPVADVSEIYDPGHTGNALTAQSAELLGKTIEATIPTEKVDIATGLPVTTQEQVKGEVESIIVKDLTVYAKIKDSDTEVPVSYITKVS